METQKDFYLNSLTKEADDIQQGSDSLILIYAVHMSRFSPMALEEMTHYHTIPHFDSLMIMWKTLREKEKLIVTSNFSFSENVFYPI